ncbi:hypothetical protein A3B21_03315 [Candidatus Uhrbacteria bacterium RIFCSPLOWO2_01_FULL_47_24]|uniref:EfeO-type cupredoxin-like domain-containing protein n=1 Tax=Candidatus Uhrbacteria bacterium RIFCSPLOWO2_01_FULL_47_24 TaxID=1802401 RepID=A0A1F7UQU6_9BACT|nr:MAG: hypothetical protein A2753_02875 [Candidatus Uhrbacteria bacterium RIFCSPHIGHO2_01_FULL_47_11]OGL68379.1 MAG: hypothetical protein A3D58_04375 [Candidatus Uhrbacteria bacterium RIFCSPHIGHO2_02_FULL_46_47]OGL75713.1 MAG: hypothetical protein A3F52_02265 [Candidatus Uhrbacteria bacterium RIFCSPHIGHO2_12_FULL_47_11]OGL80047.1 MAG: hypothetical protein A3B21_03315 [Candidatus Uhrbacteria bacterium RIFCSPLOWO2_01_FULL_47_24]OGL84513.1 MAG: hypothetical protein A3J03_01695 [Candidatus Uhrbact
MSKYLKVGLALSGIILFGAGCAKYSASPLATPATPEAAAPTAIGESQSGSEAVIEYNDGVFNPDTLRVLVGTKVTFVNKGTKEVWPASGRHPTHEICPGFDALNGLKQGETYSHVFDKTAECPFHNHMMPTEHGSIEVKAAE